MEPRRLRDGRLRLVNDAMLPECFGFFPNFQIPFVEPQGFAVTVVGFAPVAGKEARRIVSDGQLRDENEDLLTVAPGCGHKVKQVRKLRTRRFRAGTQLGNECVKARLQRLKIGTCRDMPVQESKNGFVFVPAVDGRTPILR